MIKIAQNGKDEWVFEGFVLSFGTLYDFEHNFTPKTLSELKALGGSPQTQLRKVLEIASKGDRIQVDYDEAPASDPRLFRYWSRWIGFDGKGEKHDSGISCVRIAVFNREVPTQLEWDYMRWISTYVKPAHSDLRTGPAYRGGVLGWSPVPSKKGWNDILARRLIYPIHHKGPAAYKLAQGAIPTRCELLRSFRIKGSKSSNPSFHSLYYDENSPIELIETGSEDVYKGSSSSSRDQVTLHINDKGETVIRDFAISREIRYAFMDKYGPGDCAHLSLLDKCTGTGKGFTRKMFDVAGGEGTTRGLPKRAHPDRVCRRTILVGFNGKGKSMDDSDAQPESAPKQEKHEPSSGGSDHGHAHKHPGSGNHGHRFPPLVDALSLAKLNSGSANCLLDEIDLGGKELWMRVTAGQ